MLYFIQNWNQRRATKANFNVAIRSVSALSSGATVMMIVAIGAMKKTALGVVSMENSSKLFKSNNCCIKIFKRSLNCFEPQPENGVTLPNHSA